MDGNGFVECNTLEPFGTTYMMTFELPMGYVAFSPPNQGGDDEKDSGTLPTADGPPTGPIMSFTLEPGMSNTAFNAGVFQPARLVGTLWIDNNFTSL